MLLKVMSEKRQCNIADRPEPLGPAEIELHMMNAVNTGRVTVARRTAPSKMISCSPSGEV
jgi:hypothetical protein